MPDTSGWRGPYIDRDIAAHPWGNAHTYRYEGKVLEIVSFGADGKPGGTGLNADISSLRLNEPLPHGRFQYQAWVMIVVAICRLTVYPMLARLFKSASTWFLNARLRKNA